MKYRKKPVVIEARRFNGKNAQNIRDWVRSFDDSGQGQFVTKNIAGTQAWNYIKDPEWSSDVIAAVYDRLHETWVGVKRGQWIIRGLSGEFYPCDNETFRNSYDPVEEDMQVESKEGNKIGTPGNKEVSPMVVHDYTKHDEAGHCTKKCPAYEAPRD